MPSTLSVKSLLVVGFHTHIDDDIPECCIFFSCFLFFRRQGFRMITFDRQGGPFQNVCRSRVMVIGRSVSFSDRRDPRVEAWGAPNPPSNLFVCVSGPQRVPCIRWFMLPPTQWNVHRCLVKPLALWFARGRFLSCIMIQLKAQYLWS